MPVFIVCGLTAIVLGGFCFYAASPNQCLLGQAWPRRLAHAAGVFLLLVGLLALAQEMQRLTAVFVFSTALMLVLTVLPYLGALLHVRRTR